MITDIYIEADTWAEAVQDLEKFKATFNNKCRVSMKVSPPIEEPVGYAFNWLANKSGDARKELVDEITNKIVEIVTAAVEKSFELRQFKTQEETNMLGAIELNIVTDMTKLPQKAASAASAIETAELTGASYKPIMYVGTQIVRGVNYWFICEQTIITAHPKKKIVKLAVNEFQGKFELVDNKIEVIF